MKSLDRAWYQINVVEAVVKKMRAIVVNANAQGRTELTPDEEAELSGLKANLVRRLGHGHDLNPGPTPRDW